MFFSKLSIYATPGQELHTGETFFIKVIDSGTSMAAPHVTGIVALLKATYPQLRPSELYDFVYEAATKPCSVCNENLGGYFTDDVDNTAEPMLQMPTTIVKTVN